MNKTEATASLTTAAPEPAVSAHDAVASLVHVLNRHGCKSPRIAQATGIDLAVLSDPNARLPLPRFNALWAFAARELNNPAIGLDLTEQYPDKHMHFVAHLGMRCANIRAAIEQWRKYAQLVSEVDTVDYVVEGSRARFIYRCLDMRHYSPYLPEHYISLALYYARLFSGEEGLSVHGATFVHANPGYAADYERVLGAPVQFGAAENALIFDCSLLDQPFKTADPYLRHFLETRAAQMLKELEDQTSPLLRVQQLVELMMSKGEPLTLEATAQSLEVSPRQLRQLLDKHGTSFREVLAGVRKEAARRYLRQGLNTTQIALLLGFADATSFQHAFRRWFNVSAGSYREGSCDK
jgi:AraC-like DNA-binding protein